MELSFSAQFEIWRVSTENEWDTDSEHKKNKFLISKRSCTICLLYKLNENSLLILDSLWPLVGTPFSSESTIA